MTDTIRKAFEAKFAKTDLDKRALARNDDGHYVLMQTYQAWVYFQLGFEACQELSGDISTQDQKHLETIYK